MSPSFAGKMLMLNFIHSERLNWKTFGRRWWKLERLTSQTAPNHLNHKMKKKVEAVKTTLVSFTIKDIDCVFSFILVKLDTFLTFILTFSTFDILLIWHYLDPEKLFHWVSIQSVLSNRPTIHFLSWIGGTEGNGQF